MLSPHCRTPLLIPGIARRGSSDTRTLGAVRAGTNASRLTAAAIALLYETSNSGPRTALRSLIPRVQCLHQQCLGLALLQPQFSLLQRRLSFQDVATRFSKLQTRALLRRYKTRTTTPSSLFLQTRPKETKNGYSRDIFGDRQRNDVREGMTQRHAKRDVLLLRTAGDRACRRPERLPWFARAEGCTRPESPARTLWQPPLLRGALD